MKKALSEVELFHALRKHYPPAEFALLPQVGNSTGFGTNRHADAIALGLWPSRGMHLHGFEIKSYRGDWKRELENPAKAEEIAAFCNHWWIVAAHDNIVKDDLPAGWGLFVYDAEAKSLTKKKAAPFREGKAVDLGFIAAMLRRAQEVVTPDGLIAAARAEGLEAGKKHKAEREAWELEGLRTLKEKVLKFQKASGIQIDTYRDVESIGEAVNQVLNGSVHRQRNELLRVARIVLKEFEKAEVPA